jgi:hypothetical protein
VTVRRLWNLLLVWSLAGVVLFAYAAYYLFHKGLEYFEGGDTASALARGVAGAFCLGIAILTLLSIGAAFRRNVGPHYFKWFADGKPVPESYVAGCTRDCRPTCTTACLTLARESALAGQWQPRIEGDLALRTPDGFTPLGYRIVTARQVPLWCGTDLIEVEAEEVHDADREAIVCRTWREVRRFRWTCEDMVAFVKWCAEDAATACAADWTFRAVMARAIGAADLQAIGDALARAFFRAFRRTMGSAGVDAKACDAGAARHAAEAAAYARQAASTANLATAAGAARDAAMQAVAATYEASGGDPAFPFGGSRTRIRDFVSARQRKWIEDRIGEKLRD